MRFKWFFIGSVALTTLGFASLLPYARSVALEMRKCRSAFPQDLAEFENQLRVGDSNAVYGFCSSLLRQSTDAAALAKLRDKLVPPGSVRLAPCGQWSAFGLQAQWVDDADRPVSGPKFNFLWEGGKNTLHGVPGMLEVRGEGRGTTTREFVTG